MAIKKEKLKLYKIPTIPTYETEISAAGIRGYRNTYLEHSQYDIVQYDAVKNSVGAPQEWLGPSPKEFFGIETYSELKQLKFVIDGVFEAYDRTKHNLDALSSKIYVLETTSEGTFGIPPDAYPSTDSTVRKTYVETLDTFLNVMTFYINPTGIKIQKKKLFQQIRTRGGWAFQHWGPQIGIIDLDGTTGNITPPLKTQVGTVAGLPILPQVVEEIPSASNSAALKAFRELEKWYDTDQDENAQNKGYLLALEYRQRIYVGHIADFFYEERGTNPFQLYYKIKFMVHYDAGNLAAATTRARTQIVRNAETIKYIRTLKNTPAPLNSIDPRTIDSEES